MKHMATRADDVRMSREEFIVQRETDVVSGIIIGVALCVGVALFFWGAVV